MFALWGSATFRTVLLFLYLSFGILGFLATRSFGPKDRTQFQHRLCGQLMELPSITFCAFRFSGELVRGLPKRTERVTFQVTDCVADLGSKTFSFLCARSPRKEGTSRTTVKHGAPAATSN